MSRFSIGFFNLFLSGTCIITCLFACQSRLQDADDLKRMNLKGSVREISSKKYSSYQNFQANLPTHEHSTRFTKQGLISRIVEQLSNNQRRWSNYNYSNDSLWIAVTLETGTNKYQPQTYWLYTLGERGVQRSVSSILLDSSINFRTDIVNSPFGLATEVNYSLVKYPDRTACKIIKKYDADNCIEEEQYFGHQAQSNRCDPRAIRSVFEVNKQRDVVREQVYDQNKQLKRIISYRYEYDPQENWTHKTKYIGDVSQEVETRVINYYGGWPN